MEGAGLGLYPPSQWHYVDPIVYPRPPTINIDIPEAESEADVQLNDRIDSWLVQTENVDVDDASSPFLTHQTSPHAWDEQDLSDSMYTPNAEGEYPKDLDTVMETSSADASDPDVSTNNDRRPREIVAWRGTPFPWSSKLELLIEWEDRNEPATWKDEWEIQEEYPEMLYSFWAEFGDRDRATGLEYYHIFKITRHDGGPRWRQFWVQWVGFREEEGEWICGWDIDENLGAGEYIREYLQTIGLDA